MVWFLPHPSAFAPLPHVGNYPLSPTSIPFVRAVKFPVPYRYHLIQKIAIIELMRPGQMAEWLWRQLQVLVSKDAWVRVPLSSTIFWV